MSQNEFSSLQLAYSNADDDKPLLDTVFSACVSDISSLPEIGALSVELDQEERNAYVPVNYIPPGVVSFLKAAEMRIWGYQVQKDIPTRSNDCSGSMT